MDYQALLSRVETLLEQTDGVNFVVPEDTGYFSIDEDLVKNVRGLLESTVVLLREISDHYDQGGPAGELPTGEVALQEIGAEISSELAAQELSSLAFAGRSQLIEVQGALEKAVSERHIWAVAAHAETARRRIGKALIAVEAAMREFEELPALERTWVDLEVSLEVRRMYGRFRRFVLQGDGGATGEALVDQLKGVAEAIATLRDLKIYPFMRIDDRLTIRNLQKRILSWLEGEQQDDAGRRLWQDLMAFCRLLGEVNAREELKAHDSKLVRHLHRILYSGDGVHVVAPAQRNELEKLHGLDDELDELLQREAIEPVDLEPVLSRLDRSLNPPPGVVPAFQSPFDS